jgi:uncharacterized cysteine cluster protein YcgN (CxxCxxCC family)
VALSAFRAWKDTDQLMAMALTEYEGMLCDGCGQPLYESMDPETEGRWVAPLPMRCLACTAVAQRAKEYASNPKVRAPEALRFHAELIPARAPTP